MKHYLVILALLFLAGTTQGMNFTETAYYQGIQEGYRIGALAILGQTDQAKEAEYNGLIADLNTWLASVGYTDAKWGNLPKNTAYTLPPIFQDLNKPLIVANVTGSGPIHKIDGGVGGGAKYTTNDANLLPDTARYNATTGTYSDNTGNYLGGV